MGIARRYAENIAAMGPEIMTDEVVKWTHYGLLDYMAVILAGSDEPCAEIAAKVMGTGSDGDCLIFGKSDRARAVDAALINGTAAHAHDFDDMNNSLGGHPTAVLLPAIFAIAEEIGASGKDVLHAYVVGFETQARTGKGVHLHHYEKGWHPTATLGTFGATAACCTLLGLNEDQIENAMAMAASMASGLKSNFGTSVKPLHAGLACRNGVMAARLAESGFDAAPDAFEHSQGFFEVYNGKGTYDADKIFDGWGTAPLDILAPGIAVKQYPCCGSTHAPAECAIALYEREGVPAEQIKHIDVWSHPRRLKHTNTPDPQGVLDAKFSVQYVVARCLLEGRVILDHFEEGAYNDPAVRALMAKLDAAPDPTKDPASNDHYGAEVRIEKTDGSIVSERVKIARGRTTADPIPADKMKAKFDACAARIMSADKANAVYSAIQGIDDCKDIRAFTAVVENGAAEKVQAAE
jgi:2-methylcitrate dehydratase PrpD